eukprot:scaffold11768_cov34-Phaeocystis_antarctica.AAC.2
MPAPPTTVEEKTTRRAPHPCPRDSKPPLLQALLDAIIAPCTTRRRAHKPGIEWWRRGAVRRARGGHRPWQLSCAT